MADPTSRRPPTDAPRGRLTDPFRLAALRDTGLFGAAPSATLDRLAELAAQRAGVPVALVSLVGDTGQRFPGLAGLTGLAAEERGTPLTHSFCQHVVAGAAPLVVDDAAAHPLVRDNPARAELGVAAYAGVPLTTTAGETLGALCAIDGTPRAWTAEQVAALEELARHAVTELELRATAHALAETEARLDASEARLARALGAAGMAAWEWDVAGRQGDGSLWVSAGWGPLFGRHRGDGPSTVAAMLALVHPDDRPAVRIALDDAVAGRAAYDLSYRVPLPRGGVHVLHDVGSATRDADGRVVRLAGVVRRVTA